jgi:Fic family protein
MPVPPPVQHLTRLKAADFETPAVLKATASAGRKLAELKGLAAVIPNQGILINTLALQEAKDSSAIENIITTHDELFRASTYPDLFASPAAKEVRQYVRALQVGFDLVQRTGLLTVNHMLAIQAELEQNNAGLRKLPGTALKDGAGRVIYTPPQDPAAIVALMSDLERFINDDSAFDADPLVKTAIVHHLFETLHPFYDGNGRTGRIVNGLYLVNKGLLDIPVLYLSRAIVRHKAGYYRRLQAVREEADAPQVWHAWVLYMLAAVEQTAAQTLTTVTDIKTAPLDYKHRIRAAYRFYSQDLINNLFMHPYTKIEFVERDLKVSRLTATKYLDALAAGGSVQKVEVGRSNYYINQALNAILTRAEMVEGAQGRAWKPAACAPAAPSRRWSLNCSPTKGSNGWCRRSTASTSRARTSAPTGTFTCTTARPGASSRAGCSTNEHHRRPRRRGGVLRGARAGARRAERQQGGHRRAPALRRGALVTARGRERAAAGQRRQPAHRRGRHRHQGAVGPHAGTQQGRGAGAPASHGRRGGARAARAPRHQAHLRFEAAPAEGQGPAGRGEGVAGEGGRVTAPIHTKERPR